MSFVSTEFAHKATCMGIPQKVVAHRPCKSHARESFACGDFAFEPIARVVVQSSPKTLHAVQIYAGKFFEKVHSVFA